MVDNITHTGYQIVIPSDQALGLTFLIDYPENKYTQANHCFSKKQ